jgi:ATP-dependent protease ClpP protease subunit
MTWFRIRASAGDTGEIEIFDALGAGGITADAFARQLRALGPVKRINMTINSPDGDGLAGVAIHNLLAAHPATIAAHIAGIAAYGASLAVMAADKITAPANAFIVAANPVGLTYGDAAAHFRIAADLGRLTDSYASIYAARSKQSIGAIKNVMAADRLLTAGEAKELGLIDEVVPGQAVAGSFDFNKLRAKHRDLALVALISDSRADPAIVRAWRETQALVRAERGMVR